MNKRLERGERPVFPKRAVVTGGMPYGNKSLHFGYVGGMFVHADICARFLRDRIGEDNIYFYSIAEMAILTALKYSKDVQPDMEKINLPHIDIYYPINYGYVEGMNFIKEKIWEKIYFQEKYFDSEIVM